MGNGNLPDGWALKTVDELYETIGGGTPSTAVPEYWEGDIPWITSADIADLKDIRPRKYITKDAIANSATNLAPAGSLIVVTRVSLGKVALTDCPLCFSQDSQALIAKDKSVLPEYALYYLSEAAQIFKYQSRGTTIAGVTKRQLKELPFPLPPLPEQERIVAKIEELFTQLEAGAAALKRVRAGLKRYKASVLKAAVEGRLLENRGVENGNELPEGWAWTTVGELIIDTPTNGIYLPKEKYGKGIPILRIDDFQNDFSRSSSELRQVDATPEQIDRYSLQENDLVVNRVNSMTHLGKCIVISTRNLPALFESNMMRIRFIENVEPKFIELYLHSADGKKRLIGNAKWAVNQASINQKDVANTRIPLPPLTEQRRIVAEVERRLSVAAQVESVLASSMARASRLRQAVLKRAFEGSLT